MLFDNYIRPEKSCVQANLVEAILDGGQRRVNALRVGDDAWVLKSANRFAVFFAQHYITCLPAMLHKLDYKLKLRSRTISSIRHLFILRHVEIDADEHALSSHIH